MQKKGCKIGVVPIVDGINHRILVKRKSREKKVPVWRLFPVSIVVLLLAVSGVFHQINILCEKLKADKLWIYL